jgi:hypothetical protein
VLLGDAAHAVFNYIGQGTNLAMEDGLILENILAEEREVGRFGCSVFADAHSGDPRVVFQLHQTGDLCCSGKNK